jgi:hypothetical protein
MPKSLIAVVGALRKDHSTMPACSRRIQSSGTARRVGHRAESERKMAAETMDRESAENSLRQLLLSYLWSSNAIRWPGGDGITEDDVLNYYPEARAAGKVPDWQELCGRHEAMVGTIQSFFQRKGWLERNQFRTQGY